MNYELIFVLIYQEDRGAIASEHLADLLDETFLCVAPTERELDRGERFQPAIRERDQSIAGMYIVYTI